MIIPVPRGATITVSEYGVTVAVDPASLRDSVWRRVMRIGRRRAAATRKKIARMIVEAYTR